MATIIDEQHLTTISKAINVFGSKGIDIETIIEDTTGEYVGDWSDKDVLLSKINKDSVKEFAKVEARIRSRTIQKVMTFNEKTKKEIYNYLPFIIGVTFEYIKANLQNPGNSYKNFYDFLAEIKKQTVTR